MYRSTFAFVLFVFCIAGCGTNYETVTLDEAGNLFVASAEAIEAGDTEKAMQLLTQSIEEAPSTWACLERAKLHMELGDDDAAIADCELGLTVADKDPDLSWMLKELKKSPNKRFKGKYKNPPSAKK